MSNLVIEESAFPENIDSLIFFPDADLDNYYILTEYYSLLQNQEYVEASDYIQSFTHYVGCTMVMVSDVPYYGAWLLNYYENMLYAIEYNMEDFIPVNSKPRLVYHSSTAPTDPEFKHWVYYDKTPGIPLPPTPPTPSTPDWWFNSPNVCPINDNGWEPELDSYGWNGYYELASTNEGSSNIGIDAPEIQTAAEAQIQIPLYDANGNATTYTLRNIVSEEIGDIFEGDIGWALYNGDTLVENWSMPLDWYFQTLDSIYLCCGVDTMNYTDVSRGTSGTRHDVIYACLIAKGSAWGTNNVSYRGSAIEMSQLSSRGLYLGSEWY